MTLNCRPGDLAMIVRSSVPENVGAIVRVLYRFEHQALDAAVWYWAVESFGGRLLGHTVHRKWPWSKWEIGAPEPTDRMSARDANLRPLRDTDEPDEMLRIAGVPKPSVLAPKPQREFSR